MSASEENDVGRLAVTRATEAPGTEQFDFRTALTGRDNGESILSFPSGHLIYSQTDPADAAFYVESGHVKIAAVTPSGKEAVVAIRRPGEFFGTRGLVGKRTGYASALTACSLIRITMPALIRLLRGNPDFAVAFTTHLVDQSVRDQSNIVDYLTNSAEKRLARLLLQLADCADDEEGPSPISAPLNQSILANMVGTTRSRVSYFMNDFRRRGLIEYDRQGRVRVRNSLRKAVLEA
jgi:CRP/FNR family transcriptional regulator, cyclic AMP receptor protein